MTAQPLPPRPDLDQLKRQAKELLKAYRAGDASARERWSAEPSAREEPRLRDAQRITAREHGFLSWDALRAHVERKARRGLVFDDSLPDVVPLSGPLTREAARHLAEQGTRGVKVDASVPPDTLARLAEVTTLRRIDLSNRGDVADRHLACLEALPALEEINLRWTAAGDATVAALTGKPSLHPMQDDAAFGCHAERGNGLLRIRVNPEMDTRLKVGWLTRDPVVVPCRIDMVVKPVEELHIYFAKRGLVFTADGSPEIDLPAYIQRAKMSDRDSGTGHPQGTSPAGDWTRVTLEIEDTECRLLVNGVLRHTWRDTFAGLRSRVGLGPRRSEVTVREVNVHPASGDLRRVSGSGDDPKAGWR